MSQTRGPYYQQTCEDSRCFPPEVSETAAWNLMVWPSPKWWNTTTDRSDFTASSPVPLTRLGILACGSTWRQHTGKHGSSASHQCITQPTWPQVASPTWWSTEQVAWPAMKRFHLRMMFETSKALFSPTLTSWLDVHAHCIQKWNSFLALIYVWLGKVGILRENYCG